MRIQTSITQVSERMVNNVCNVFKLIIDESTEPVIPEEDEVLEDILIRLESISHRIDDMRLVRSKSVPRTLFWNAFETYLIQCSLIKNNDEESSLDLDISEIDF